MRIKKLLIAGALMLTAVGCVSAYTIYADTLNNNTDKQVSATTEGKSTTETTKNTTEQKNNKKNAVKEDSKDTTNDVSATTEEEKILKILPQTIQTMQIIQNQNTQMTQMKPVIMCGQKKQLHMMKRMDIIGQLIAKNVELLKQSQPQKRIMKDSTLQQK